MDEAGFGTDDLGEVGQESDDVMLDLPLDCVDALDVKGGLAALFPDDPGGFLRRGADLGHGVEGMRLNLIGRNLLTFTDYKGYDPEVGGAVVRLDSFDYPRNRTITGSVEIRF